MGAERITGMSVGRCVSFERERRARRRYRSWSPGLKGFFLDAGGLVL